MLPRKLLSVSAIAAPDYPACLYGSQRYRVDVVYNWSDDTRDVESRLFKDRGDAVFFAETLEDTNGASVSVVD